jgi:hypothetical protein
MATARSVPALIPAPVMKGCAEPVIWVSDRSAQPHRDADGAGVT